MVRRSAFTTAREVIMLYASLAGALAGALIFAATAEAAQSVLTYHGSLDRAGRYVVPGLTYERARGLHLDASFHAAFQGEVYAQPLFWRPLGSGRRPHKGL
jgi:hypothetical protein